MITNNQTVKVAIIGSGVAGATVAIYLGLGGINKSNQNLILFAGPERGGQLTTTNVVENYPGFKHVSGMELADNLIEHAEQHAEFIEEIVIKIEKKDSIFIISTENQQYFAENIVICTGSSPKKLPIASPFDNKGVSYCYICDGFLYKNQSVIVVGGGNSAFESAKYLSKICKKVYLVHRSENFRAFHDLQEKVRQSENIEVITNSQIQELIPDEKGLLSKVVVENNNQERRTIEAKGMFIHIGHNPQTSFVKDLVKCDKEGYIIVNRNQETSVKGILAAGDCCHFDDNYQKYQQAITAGAEGCVAALWLLSLIS